MDAGKGKAGAAACCPHRLPPDPSPALAPCGTWGLGKLRLVVWEWLLNPPASLPPLGTLVGLWAREGGGHGG